MSTEQTSSIDLPFTGGGDLFTVTVTHVHSFRRGWGVDVTPVYAGEDDENPEQDPDEIVDLVPEIIRIDRDTVRVIGHTPCVPLTDPSGSVVFWAPAESFHADGTGDHRESRWFASLPEAIAYRGQIAAVARRLRVEHGLEG